MSVVNGNGKANLLISYLLQSKDLPGQVEEEQALKNEIAKLLHDKGYKFVIADDELINEKLVKE